LINQGKKSPDDVIKIFFQHFQKDFLQKNASTTVAPGAAVDGDDHAMDSNDSGGGELVNDSIETPAAVPAAPAMKPVTMQIDSAEPINEFLDNDLLLCGSFFDIIGSFKSIKKFKTSCFNKSFSKHLLLQFTKNAASCSPFMFFIMDQMRRFECVRKTALKLKNAHPEKKAEFETLLSSPGIDEMVKFALQNPGSDEAKSLIRRVEPFVNFAAKQIPYSNAQRRAFLSTIYANCIHRGLPSIYFTLSNDVKGVFQIRMSFPLKNGNRCFPSDPTSFLESLDKGDHECDGISVENDSLSDLISKNPVAAASTFIRLLRFVWKNLFGLQMEDEVKSTISRSMNSGIFDVVYGCNSIIETQDRDLGLHTHGVLWSRMSPNMITACANIRSLREKVAAGKLFLTIRT